MVAIILQHIEMYQIGEGNGNPLQYSCLENSMDGWRSLVGYSPWGCKESHNWAAFHFHSHFLNTMVVLIIALKTGMLDYIFSILLKYCVDKVILKNIVTKKKKKRNVSNQHFIHFKVN